MKPSQTVLSASSSAKKCGNSPKLDSTRLGGRFDFNPGEVFGTQSPGIELPTGPNIDVTERHKASVAVSYSMPSGTEARVSALFRIAASSNSSGTDFLR